jgi:hypothetical protein
MIPAWAEQILLAVLEAVGTDLAGELVSVILKRQAPDAQKAILDAQYDAMEAALDAEQKAVATEP